MEIEHLILDIIYTYNKLNEWVKYTPYTNT